MGNVKTSSSWKSSMVAAISLAFFGISVAAFADTYNFYFKQGKKKPGAVETQEKSSNTDVDANPEVAAEDAAEEAKADRHGASGQTPIIINNNINGLQNESGRPRPYSPPDDSSYNPEDRPPAKPIGARSDLPTSTAATSMATVAPAPQVESARKHLRFGLSYARWNRKGWADLENNNFNQSSGPGAVATLGIDFTSWFGVNVIGGRVRDPEVAWNDDRLLFGAEVQFTPFRLDMGSWDLLELGFLTGTTNLNRSLFSEDSLHFGIRAGINFGRSFGITSTARASRTFTMAEAGIVARF